MRELTVKDIEQIVKQQGTLLSIKENATVSEAANKMTNNHVGCLVVFDMQDKFVGIITERDIIAKMSAKTDSTIGSVLVRDIMTTEVVMVDGSATVAEAVRLMKEKGVRALIVDRRSEEDAYGIVTQRDVVYSVMAERKDPTKVKVHEVMTKPLVVVNPDLDAVYVARLMAQKGLSRAPVIYEQKLQGVVSVTDLITKAM